MSDFPETDRNRIHRIPARGSYDRETVYQIIDEALVCHVGFAREGQPFTIPMLHARRDDTLYLHGARGSRLFGHLREGSPVCVSIALLDGIVFARSAYHHSMNYRSVVLFGEGREVETEEEKERALEILMEHVAPGRWREVRRPSPAELAATSVAAIRIQSASAKLRSGPPVDDEADFGLPVWAGELPLRQAALTPQPDPESRQELPVPGYLAAYRRPFLTVDRNP
jgi:nitroimidazol reductase NimA-like FMN-containing flavoprotein (pyridoxamine 5'-phosphate oxidase superfamily)